MTCVLLCASIIKYLVRALSPCSSCAPCLSAMAVAVVVECGLTTDDLLLIVTCLVVGFVTQLALSRVRVTIKQLVDRVRDRPTHG